MFCRRSLSSEVEHHGHGRLCQKQTEQGDTRAGSIWNNLVGYEVGSLGAGGRLDKIPSNVLAAERNVIMELGRAYLNKISSFDLQEPVIVRY